MVTRQTSLMGVAMAAWLGFTGGCELFASLPTGQVGAADHCTADVHCPVATPYCDLGAEACIQCRTNDDCSSDEPACLSGACTSCVIDADCGGTTCLPDGTCADPARVVYASPTGLAAADCSLPSPCDLDTAVTKLSATIDIVELLPGTYTRMTPVPITTTATLSGSSATLQSMGATAIDVEAGNLTLLDVAIAANAQIGVICQGSGHLSLHRVRITGATTGVYAQPCAVEIDRSSITGGTGYGAIVATGPLTMQSSFVTGNGGGVAVSDATGSIIQSTIAANTVQVGTSGLLCTNSPSFTAANDIIWTNPVDPMCVVNTSDLDAGYTGTGTNNLTMDPLFVSAPVDYHLMATSPVRGAGDPAQTTTVDIDGEPRPQPSGTPPDLGADEVP